MKNVHPVSGAGFQTHDLVCIDTYLFNVDSMPSTYLPTYLLASTEASKLALWQKCNNKKLQSGAGALV